MVKRFHSPRPESVPSSPADQMERCGPPAPLLRFRHNLVSSDEHTMSTTPVDHPDRGTVAVRQGTGPRATVSVLLISTVLAAVVGVVLLAYFVSG